MPLKDELADVDRQIQRFTFGASDLEPARADRTLLVPDRVRHVLVATDGTAGSDSALAWAESLAGLDGSRLTLAVVIPPRPALDAYGAAAAGIYPEEQKRGWEVLQDAAQRLRKADLEPEVALLSGSPAIEISNLAERKGADLIVVGSHGQGAAARLLLGSVADGVKNHASSSVLIARSPPPPKRLLLPTDGSRESRRAARVGLRLARAWDAEATLLHVVAQPMFAPPESGRKAFEYAFDDLGVSSWREPGITYDLQFGNPAERILDAADEERTDLVVMGSRGLGGLASLVAGSVSNRVAHQSRASVLLVKDGRAHPRPATVPGEEDGP